MVQERANVDAEPSVRKPSLGTALLTEASPLEPAAVDEMYDRGARLK
ncbi:hypothetical protein [Bradyrhizobium macuxiense]|nr:hypothetical protein [Bradyrhizobium macuxiense]